MTNEATRAAEGAYKLAEIDALEAEQAAQITRKRSEWYESYGSMADALAWRVAADEDDAKARVLEDKATTLYQVWVARVEAPVWGL